MELFYTGILAGVALVFKATILLQVVTLSNLNRAFNLLAIGFILQHAFEFLALMVYQSQPALSEYMVSGVLVSAYFIATSFLHLSLTINPILYARELKVAGWLAFAALCLLHFSGEVMSGIVETSYSLVSVAGPQYAAALSFLLLSIVFVVIVIAHGALRGDAEVRRLSIYTGTSMLPIVIAALSVLFLRLAGYQSSSAMAMPVVSTYFVWKMMHFELGNIAIFTMKWSVFWFQIRQAFAGVIWRQNYSVAEQFADLEKHRIETALPLCDYNVAAASRLLNMSWSNVDRKCKQYGLGEGVDPA